MENQEQVRELHSLINDVFTDIIDVKVNDETSRKARENAIFDLIKIRRHVDAMGLRHDAVVKGGAHGCQG